HSRVVAAEYRRETLAIDQAVEARTRGDHGRAQLAPEPGRGTGAAFQQQAGDAEQGLAQKVAADPAGHLVVEGGRGVLARFLPEEAACERVGRGLPEVESRRARQVLIDRALVGM